MAIVAKNFARLTTVANVQAAPAGSAAKLISVLINKGTANAVVNVYHGTTTGGTLIAAIDGATKSEHNFQGVACPNGIFVDQVTAAADVTIITC
jgi:hypothetical protein